MTSSTVRAEVQLRPRVALPRGRGSRFRADVEGLRAVAVVAVLLFHAHVPGITGGFVGVDVFFVVSGFLITGLLMRELSTTGRIRFGRFYARRAKRLLPAGTLVLVATALATWLFLPVSQWPMVSVDVAGAALFVVNWVFAARATDYLGAELAASPVQHFWSLSVEEQFYLLWPALLLIFGAVAARRGMRLRRGLLLAMLLVLVPSLTWCVWATTHTPASAYFSSLTRLWELALGGVIALTAHEWRGLPASVRSVLGWLGLGLILTAVLFIDTTTPFPGTAALIPTFGAAALLAAGMGSERPGPVSRALSTRPMVWIGGLSYSLYLWHWPVVAILEQRVPGVAWPILVAATVAASLPAWLSLKLVENPVRHAARLRRSTGAALVMGVVLIVISLAAGILLGRASGGGGSADLSGVPNAQRGAAVLRDPAWVASHPQPVESFDPLLPAAVDARTDNPAPNSADCQLWLADAVLRDCRYGNRAATFQVAIAGDSKLSTWVPALIQLTAERGWGLHVIMKPRCPLTDSTVTIRPDGAPSIECQTWRRSVREHLAQDPPDLLLLTAANSFSVTGEPGDRLRGDARKQEIERGFRVIAEEAEARGTTPVFIADTPMMSRQGQLVQVPDCVASNPTTLSACAVSRSEAVDLANPIDRILASDDTYAWRTIDLTDAFCLPEWCPAVVGHVIIYRDVHHVTKAYADTLTPWVADALRPWAPAQTP